MSIPFTQYQLPNGKASPVEIDMPEDVEKRAHALIEAGCHFDIEVLTTGLISMTCEKDDDILSIEVCENGLPVVNGVRKIVEIADSLTLRKVS